MSLRLLGIQIANGYSPEARVFAGLLGQRSGEYEAEVFHHAWFGDRQSAERFFAAADVSLRPFDTGWRPNPGGQRSVQARVASHIQFRFTLLTMLREARKFQPDILYSCQQHWDCYAATYLARRLGKPQIVHLHYTIGEWLHRPVLERLLTTDHVITVSDFIRHEALRHGVPEERVTTIRNTMRPLVPLASGTREAVRDELGIPRDAAVIGIIARLDLGKGQDDTISAFTRVAAYFPDARLVIVGDGTQSSTLKGQAVEAGLATRVLFTGRRADVPRLLAAFDIFAHPSRYDPCPLALLEAAAAGLPIVAYAEGGANEIVIHESTGLLSPPGDVRSLAVHMCRLASNPEMAKSIGAAGRQHIAGKFRPETAGHDFNRLLHAVSGNR